MSTEHLILCGGAKLSSRRANWQRATALELQIGERHGNVQHTGNVNVRISDIREGMLTNLPAVGTDLIEVAAYIYCADQATTRGGTHSFEYGKVWRRRFRFEIPVRKPDIWNDTAVKDALRRTVGFLSDDDYEFEFHAHPNPPKAQSHFDFTSSGPDVREIDDVLLFSGGLDSLGGAVEHILNCKRRVALVSHAPVRMMLKRQRELVDAISRKLHRGQPRPLHIQVEVNKDSELNHEYTQRSRSFLYAALGAVVARIFGLRTLYFCENGVVSFNLPASAQVIGGRSTRSTHPRSIAGFRTFLSRLFATTFEIDNPFLWKTKTEILKLISGAGVAELCAQSSSCTHTRQLSAEHTHCGSCTQCVDRRLVTLAAGFRETEDPQSIYAEDVLTGPRDDDVERTIVESYVRVANEIEVMSTPMQFITRFPEMSRAFNHLNLPNEEVLERTFDLHKRHAKQILAGLDGLGGRRLMQKFRRSDIPSTSLLAIAYQRRGTEEKPAGAPNDLVFDDRTLTVTYRRRVCPFNSRSKLRFCLMRELIRHRGRQVLYDSLRAQDNVWDGSQPEDITITGAVSRLRKHLCDNGLSKLAILIETGFIDKKPYVILKTEQR